jgi:hypothetical protein
VPVRSEELFNFGLGGLPGLFFAGERMKLGWIDGGLVPVSVNVGERGD